MIMNSIFAILRLLKSLLAFRQQLRFRVYGSRSARVQPGMLILVSSANISAQAVVRQFGRSLIHIRKSRGPITLHRGTWQFISLSFDRASLTLHF